MWWAGSRRRAFTDVFLGGRLGAVLHPVHGLRHGRAADEQGARELVLGWLGADRNQRLRVWLGGALCQPFLLPRIAGVADRDELRLAAAAMAPRQTTLAEPCTLWIDAQAQEGPSVAAAVATATLQALQTSVASAGHLVSIRPWWGEALRWALAVQGPGLQTLGVDDGESLTLLSGPPGAFDAVSCVVPLADAGAAQAAWARALVVADTPEDAARRVSLDFSVDEAAQEQACAFGRWMRVDGP